MRRISLATAIAGAFLVAGLSAQAPNFAGKWVSADPPPADGGGGGGGRGGGRGGGGGQFCGQECTITQDATSLTVTRTTQAGEQKATYKLDGSESKNPGGRGGGEVVSKASVSGGMITITTANPGRDGGPGVTVKRVISMVGGQMVVEQSIEGGQGAAPTKQTYKKG